MAFYFSVWIYHLILFWSAKVSDETSPYSLMAVLLYMMFISHLLSSKCSLSLNFPSLITMCVVWPFMLVAQWATPAIPVRWDQSGFLWKWPTMLKEVGVHLGFYLAHGRNRRPGAALWVHCCAGLEKGQCRLVFSLLSNTSVSSFAVQKCASVSRPMSAFL